jgi:1-phosphofructokinase
MVLTVTLNPALDVHMFVARPRLGALNQASAVHLSPSGKGLNVSRALSRQGVRSTAIVPLGGPFGEVIQALLRASDIDIDLRAVAIAGATRSNTKVVDEDSAVLTEFNAPGPELSAEELESCCMALFHALRYGDTVVLSGSLPPGLEPDTYAHWIAGVKGRGAQGFLDTAGPALQEALAAGPDLVKPNRQEAEALLDTPIRSYGDALGAAREIQAQGAGRVVLSLGEHGAVFLARQGCLFVKPPKVKPYSTNACGDAMLAGVVVGLSHDWPWERVARYATAVAAARAVMKGPELPDEPRIRQQLGGVTVIPAEEIDPEEPLGGDDERDAF